jgi:hypothetical protein
LVVTRTTAPNTNGDKPKRASLITTPASHARQTACWGKSLQGVDQDIYVGAKSFETPHPLNIIQVLYFLISWSADRSVRSIPGIGPPVALHHQPQPVLDEGSERASLCSGLPLDAVKQTFGKSDSEWFALSYVVTYLKIGSSLTSSADWVGRML